MLLEKILDGERLSYEEGVEVLGRLEWTDLAKAAWRIRCKKLGDRKATYTMFRVINYTNICMINCKFCGFRDDPDSKNCYVLNIDQVRTKVEEALERGVKQIFFQGGVNPDLPLDYYIEIIHSIKEYGVHIRGFSPVEILNLSKLKHSSIGEVLDILKDAGVDSIPGAGAEILSERMRKKLSPEKCTTEEWCSIMEECHKHGLPGSATMVVGAGETIEEIVNHLESIRQIQDKTGGFFSFIPWIYQQQTDNFEIHPLRPDEFLKILAFSRIYLDNIEHLEMSVLVLGKDLGKLALRMGADDISSVVWEENVLQSYGIHSEDEAIQYLNDAGFEAQRRDFNYRWIY